MPDVDWSQMLTFTVSPVEELEGMLREHEIDDVSEVARAYLEPDGQLTVFRKKGRKGESEPERKSRGV